jgi:sec-independent protein translocase protein TatA
MFDNPEKLFILFVIALMIFGPTKLASLGASLGRSIRDFRNTVRGAQDEFRSAVQEHVDSITPALPSPDSFTIDSADSAAGTTGTVEYGTAMSTPAPPEVDAVSAYAPQPAAEAAAPHALNGVAASGSPEDDPSSIVSEPTAAALKESLSR